MGRTLLKPGRARRRRDSTSSSRGDQRLHFGVGLVVEQPRFSPRRKRKHHHLEAPEPPRFCPSTSSQPPAPRRSRLLRPRRPTATSHHKLLMLGRWKKGLVCTSCPWEQHNGSAAEGRAKGIHREVGWLRRHSQLEGKGVKGTVPTSLCLLRKSERGGTLEWVQWRGLR